MQKQARDPLADLELHRQHLEENIENLRKSLRYWQTWEAEYEGLKEEIQALPKDCSFHDLSLVANDFGGDLLTAKEIFQLLGGGGAQRSSAQVTDILSRRVDYVQRNVNTIKTQVAAAEGKLQSVSVISNPDNSNEEGLPITDIYEALDDHGNVISSRTSHPADAEPDILDALNKAGLKEEDISKVPETPSSTRTPTRLDNPTSIPAAPSIPNNDPDDSTRTTSARKSVTFAAIPETESSAQARELDKHRSASTSAADIAHGSFAHGDRVLELDETDNIISSLTAPTVEDTPEDAALRRQMQAYSMAEVGNIVARLDLDEQGSEGSSSGLEDVSDDEDEFGMSAGSQLSDEYIEQMRDLEQKLDARAIRNVGPNFNLPGEEKVALDARKLVVQRAPSDGNEKEQGSEVGRAGLSGAKSVRFAEELDVAPPLASQSSASATPLAVQPKQAPPMAGSVIERARPEQETESSQRKVSRFKQARQNLGSPSVVSNQETGQHSGLQSSDKPVLANKIVEKSAGLAHPPGDEFDSEAVRRQVNSEYYRQRNQIIQKQGGFKRDKLVDSEATNYEEDNENQNPKKKISLFKAARVQADGRW